MKLTIAKIKAAQPHSTPLTKTGHPRFAKYGDGRGLHLMVGPNGRKTWQYIYIFNKKTRYMGLGPVNLSPSPIGAPPRGEGLTLDAARDKVFELRRLVKAGVDPKAQLEAERSAILAAAATGASDIPTFGELAERYIAAHEPGDGDNSNKWSPKTVVGWRGRMRDYILPAIGEKLVNAVTSDDVAAILRPIWDTKVVVSDKVKGQIGKVLAFAAAKKWREDDNITRAGGPLEFEFKPHSKRNVKNHDSMPYAELPAFMSGLRREQGFASRALELLILTAARTTEILDMTWGEVDLDNSVWTVPASRMKAGLEHRIPLSAAAVAVLRKVLPGTDNQRIAPTEYVFPSPQARHAPFSNQAMVAVLKRMGRKDGITVHGFRATFKTWAAEKNLDIPREVAEAALAHTVPGVEGVYLRGTHFETRRDLMERWCDYAKASS